MIHVTCFNCGRRFDLDVEFVAQEVARSGNLTARHYIANCPHCRRAIKVQIKKLRRHIEAAAEALAAEAAQAEEQAKEEAEEETAAEEPATEDEG